jgi:hypothetical protein
MMQSTMTRILAIGWLFILGSIATAGDAKFDKDFQPRDVQFPAKAIPLKEALALLEKQSGNTVLDLRKVHLNNPTLIFKTRTFWETLDALGNDHGIGFSVYQADGAIALVDTPYPKRTTYSSGPFRFAVKRVSVTRDAGTQTHFGQVSLEAAWEPRLQPLYLGVDHATVRFAKMTQDLERQPLRPIIGSGATEVVLRMDAPNRKVLAIDALEGALRVIAAPRMLEFKFDKLKPMKADKPRVAELQDGVKISLQEVQQPQGGAVWTVRMLLTYPEGALIPLESHQFWYGNNKVWLSWTDAATKTARTLETTEQYEAVKEGIRVTMQFAPTETTPFPPASANVTLHLRTPSRLAAITVPFVFRDLPLP